MKNKNVKEVFTQGIKIFWIFIIGSIIGCIVETGVGILFDHTFQIRQGLIYGPFIPVYGIGAILYYFLVSKIKDPKKVFGISMILGGSVEYFCSFFQELIFGTVSWDYSHMFLNIGGRTSLLFCLFWGIAGVVFVTYIFPAFQKLDSYIDRRTFRVLTAMLSIFMVFNIGISCIAGVRQNERMQRKGPETKLDAFIDRHYPDWVMDKVYSNKIPKVKVVKNRN